MSLLKSPHNIYVWFGCMLIWSVMVFWMVGMRGRSSSCEGIYSRSQGCRGWLAMRVIWRKGDMAARVGILEMLLGNACLMCTRRRRPPLKPL